MGIALGIKAEWLLAPCKGSIQSYEVDDMLPLRGVYLSILCTPRRCRWVDDMLPLRGAQDTCSRTSLQDDILIYNQLTGFALIYTSGNTDVHHLGVYLLRLKA